MTNDNAFKLSRSEQGVAHIVIDVVADTMNTLKAEFAEQFSAVIEEIAADSTLNGVVISSGKKDSFIAGADVAMIASCQTAEEASALSKQGQLIFNALEQLKVPVVAAINGPCLGGGLELAMACHYRVCSDSDKTVLGLPEVQLGLLPGGGGTQRLPRIIGIQKALDLMLTGKQLRPQQAKKYQLVDDVVPNSVLLEVAEKLALQAKPRIAKVKRSLLDKVLENNALGRNIVFNQASKTVLSKTKGNYPAPLNIIACVKAQFDHSLQRGYDTEAKLFGELAISSVSNQLRNLFFATTEMKKELGVADVQPQKINKVGVLGGGLMGGGIAYVSVDKAKVPIRIKDINHQGISNALKYSYDLMIKKVKRRFISKTALQSTMAMITGTTNYQGFSDLDMVIEAVFEDLSLKQQMVADVETNCKPSTIFASNTSSLPIKQIAQNAQRPENVIGLHYFSPVDKMPLVEIIAHEKTSAQTISTTVAFARKQGKTPIVVKDTAGFYVNRILAPYMNEAANLVLAGEPIEKIDRALVNYGFPVGPMQLLDEVGIDVGAKISPILEQELGSRFKAPDAFSQLIADGRKGKKSAKGFYLYNNKKSTNKKQVDETVYAVLGVQANSRLTEKEIAERCVFQLVNEAMRCLDEQVIRNVRDGDIGAIFGIGFPPFLGGPFRLIDSVGASYIVAKLNQWQLNEGERFTPASSLVELATNKTKLYCGTK